MKWQLLPQPLAITFFVMAGVLFALYPIVKLLVSLNINPSLTNYFAVPTPKYARRWNRGFLGLAVAFLVAFIEGGTYKISDIDSALKAIFSVFIVFVLSLIVLWLLDGSTPRRLRLLYPVIGVVFAAYSVLIVDFLLLGQQFAGTGWYLLVLIGIIITFFFYGQLTGRLFFSVLTTPMPCIEIDNITIPPRNVDSVPISVQFDLVSLRNVLVIIEIQVFVSPYAQPVIFISRINPKEQLCRFKDTLVINNNNLGLSSGLHELDLQVMIYPKNKHNQYHVSYKGEAILRVS